MPVQSKSPVRRRKNPSDKVREAQAPGAPHRPPSPIADALLGWYRSGYRDLPWRKTKDPYAIWVSEIMLQQTRV
ncbi:MAG: hypothetical protein KIT83_13150, partial [Bryobacterales bacterium]|nr:hypothetical protein [Bryobacterales bacterium]